MEAKSEKIFVAIGADTVDGFATLQWTLSKWSNHLINIVILHSQNGTKKDYVYTPLGKLPVSTVNEEKLKDLEKTEEAKSDRILSSYIAFCGRVGIKAGVIKLEKTEQQLHKQMVGIISNFQITKLVMSLAFMKSASWKSNTAISGSFYVLRHRPDFCEVFVICGGRLVFLREENDEGFMEDDRGFMVPRVKERNHSIRNWIGKMFVENDGNNSPSSSRSNESPRRWRNSSEEIEQYASELMVLLEEEGEALQVGNIAKSIELQLQIPQNMAAAERIHLLKDRIQCVKDAIQLNKKLTNATKERIEKAQWAITKCNAKAEELETCINMEFMKNIELNKELEIKKDYISELQSELTAKRDKLSSVLQLQKELSEKHNMSSSARARTEAQLEKAAKERAHTVQEIEELRKQRGVFQRRIEFCKEKDAIGKASKLNGFSFDYREFSAAEIVAATENFSESFKLKSTNVYRGRINCITVAIKLHNSSSLEAFAAKVKLLSLTRHPNVLAMIGFCSELKCIVHEYMHNGSLHDALNTKPLTWHDRVRIASEICSGLAFLHKAKPKPIIHGRLTPSKVLLDRNNIARISSLESSYSHEEPNLKLDIQAFGKLVLQLLINKNNETATGIGDLLDHLHCVAMRCSLVTVEAEESITITAMPMIEIDDVKRRADQLVADNDVSHSQLVSEEEDCSNANIPSAFLCPIYQDVMKNPYLAADGFSYEVEAIEEWLKTGHDTSPMTNLRLKHKQLTPNHTLRSVILDWQHKRSAARMNEGKGKV